LVKNKNNLELFPAFRFIFLANEEAKKDAAAIGAKDKTYTKA